MAVQAWRIEQLGGDRKVLLLPGYSAPFGRPRDKAIFRDKIKIRHKTTRYPGNSSTVTRHVFGDEYAPWELTGRFMDRDGGPGYANRKTKEVTDFVRDKQEVRISWGSVASYVGFIDEFDPGHEGDADVAWTMSIQIDESDDAAPEQTFTTPTSPSSRLAMLRNALNSVSELEKLPDLKLSVFDAFAKIISSISQVTSTLTNVVNQITSYEQATVGQIQQLRASLGQVRTSVVSLRNLMFSTRNDAIGIRRSFGTDSATGGLFARIDDDSMFAIAMSQDMDRDAAIAQRGKNRTSHVASGGDTWESISTNAYGSPAHADALRQANGARNGSKPQPGRKYQIPHHV